VLCIKLCEAVEGALSLNIDDIFKAWDESTESIQTYSGRKVNPLNLEAQDVSILDIASSLAATSDYGGHTLLPYSLAQHCILCAQIVPPAYAFEALMHDCSKAYLPAFPPALKHSRFLGEIYLAAERRIMDRLSTILGFAYPFPECVHAADEVLCATEIRDLQFQHPVAGNPAAPLVDKIIPWSWEKARADFLKTYAELLGERAKTQIDRQAVAS